MLAVGFEFSLISYFTCFIMLNFHRCIHVPGLCRGSVCPSLFLGRIGFVVAIIFLKKNGMMRVIIAWLPGLSGIRYWRWRPGGL